VNDFPILLPHRFRQTNPDYPTSVPWSFIEPGRAQAKRNHDQTLERLAERGGLAPGEMRCALEGRRLFDEPWTEERIAHDAAWLLEALAKVTP